MPLLTICFAVCVDYQLRRERVMRSESFRAPRQGSHVRMKHEDNRVVTVPVHKGKNIGKGLLRKILRDAELTVEEFIELL